MEGAAMQTDHGPHDPGSDPHAAAPPPPPPSGPAVPSGAPPPPAKKGPPKGLWIGLGCGAAGCLALVALAVVAAIVIPRLDRDDEILSTETEEPLVAPPDGGAAPPAPDGEGGGDQQYRSQIEGQLLAQSAVYTGQGYAETHDPFIDRLSPDATDSINFELEADVEYVVIGVCDTDCSDLDLRLKDENGNTIDEDFATDDFPIVEVTPSWTGRFDLEVVMADCDAAYCYYGVAIYGKR
jgi:hypothetical protein